MKFSALVACALVGVPGVFSLAWLGGPQQKAASQPPQAEAVVRTVNTAEAEYRTSRGVFGDLEDIISGGLLKTPNASVTAPTVADETTATVDGYKLSVVSSPDGKHYSVTVEADPPSCRTAFFSDESGVIYTGQALGCPAPSAMWGPQSSSRP